MELIINDKVPIMNENDDLIVNDQDDHEDDHENNHGSDDDTSIHNTKDIVTTTAFEQQQQLTKKNTTNHIVESSSLSSVIPSRYHRTGHKRKTFGMIDDDDDELQQQVIVNKGIDDDNNNEIMMTNNTPSESLWNIHENDDDDDEEDHEDESNDDRDMNTNDDLASSTSSHDPKDDKLMDENEEEDDDIENTITNTYLIKDSVQTTSISSELPSDLLPSTVTTKPNMNNITTTTSKEEDVESTEEAEEEEEDNVAVDDDDNSQSSSTKSDQGKSLPTNETPTSHTPIENDSVVHDDTTMPQDDRMTSNDDEYDVMEDILVSTEALFDQVTDKTTVTVKDILQSLGAEYNSITFTKSMKDTIRKRLIELMTASMNTNDTSDKDDDDEEEDNDDMDQTQQNMDDTSNVHDNDVGDSDTDDNSEAPVDDADEEAVPSDDDDDEYTTRHKKKTNKKKKSSTTSSSSSSKDGTTTLPKRKLRSKKPSISSTKLSLRVHAEQRRKRRLEELRIRNEELMSYQNSIDQKRSELIASKFITNTIELRQERLQQRIQLINKLNTKRIQTCCSSTSTTTTIKNESMNDTQPNDECKINWNLIDPKNEMDIRNNEADNKQLDTTDTDKNTCNEVDNDHSIHVHKNNETEDKDNDDDDDDDDDELEIVGNRSMLQTSSSVTVSKAPSHLLESKLNKIPVVRPSNSVMALLDMADSNLLSKRKSNHTNSSNRLVSPRQNIDPRVLLRCKLKEKQRSLGNRWLARELGYKTEEEHIKVCMEEEEMKRERIFKKEQERIQATERINERLLQSTFENDEDEYNDDEPNPDDKDENNEGNKKDHDDDDDDGQQEDDEEEVIMAREVTNDDHNEISNTFMEEDDDEINHLEGNDSCNPHTSVLDSREEPDKMDQIDDKELTMESIPPFNDESILCPEVDPSNESDTKELRQIHIQGPLSPIQDVSPDETSRLDDDDEQDDTSIALGETTLMDVPSNVTDGTESNDETENVEPSKPKGPRNSAWQAILQRDAEKAKKKKRSQLIEEEADEEEEEEVAGLEDFGFVVQKKKNGDDDDEADLGEYDEDDLKHVVDDLSDDEGDELAGKRARKAMEAKEEKERHKEMLRRMRDGYDGRRGGIAGAGTSGGARGFHRFDEIVAADNREDAKQLGLLNDDEMDSDNEEEDGVLKTGDTADNEEDDEHILLDKMLKARFLHRSTVEEENFSDDEEEDDNEGTEAGDETLNKVDEEEKEQERLAKRFAKRARMQRLIELHGHDAEFSQSKLIDEDTTMKLELQRMKNGLIRKCSESSSNAWQATTSSVSANSQGNANKRQKTGNNVTFATSLLSKGGSLAIALQANRKSNKERTSFVQSSSNTRGSGSTAETTSSSSSSFHKCIAFNHVGFHASNSNTGSRSQSMKSNMSTNNSNNKHGSTNQDSLFSKLTVGGFHRKKKI